MQHDPSPLPPRLTWVHTDHLGTPKAMSDENATPVWAAWHEPFGRAHLTLATDTLPIRFPGQYHDQRGRNGELLQFRYSGERGCSQLPAQLMR